MNKEKLKQIFDDVVYAVGSKVPSLVSFDICLDCAVRIYISESIAAQRQSSFNRPQNSTVSNAVSTGAISPATEKQIHMLKNLNIPYKVGMTKIEASKLISDRLGK